jgi:V8-like Glu-specific endopeptidase
VDLTTGGHAHFLNAYPVNWTDDRVRELHGALATSIYREREIEQVVVAAGISPADVGWSHPARTLWYDAINQAAGQNVLRALVDSATERYAGLKARVDEIVAKQPVVGAKMPSDQPGVLTPADPGWKGFSGGGRERQIVGGDETLLDISFLERGLQKAAAVCRLKVRMPSNRYYGTAFRIGPALLLTNHHILYDWANGDARALSVEAAFGYEVDLEGKLRKATLVECDVETIKGERAHDFALISTRSPLPNVPVLSLAAHTGVGVDDRVYIVQHPQGLPKKIAMAHNLVRHVDDDVIQYWTDTNAGSSGSPVFNQAWDLVALHHQWVESPADEGSAYRNQGRNITRVAERVTALGADLDGE